MTVADLRKILRSAPNEAEVVLAHHGQHVAFVGYGVDRDHEGTATCITLKTAAFDKESK
jgi:hypothetical protein